MLGALVGTKQSQAQAFTEDGVRIPVTVITSRSLCVVCVKTKEKDGYDAVQVGLGTRRSKTLTNPEKGHIKKAGMEANPPRFLREVPVIGDDISQFTPGAQIKISDVLAPGDIIAVTGTSKGKGFQGGVGRYGFHGGPRTHGQSDRERAPGSIGAGTTPGRIYKGKRMAGRTGNDTVTIKNLQVISVNDDEQSFTIKGVVPGPRNSVVLVKKIIG